MRLTAQDRIELLKAAVKADDLEELKKWLADIVDASEAPGDSSANMPLPPFRGPRETAAPAPQAAMPAGTQSWQMSTLPAGNGAHP